MARKTNLQVLAEIEARVRPYIVPAKEATDFAVGTIREVDFNCLVHMLREHLECERREEEKERFDAAARKTICNV